MRNKHPTGAVIVVGVTLLAALQPLPAHAHTGALPFLPASAAFPDPADLAGVFAFADRVLVERESVVRLAASARAADLLAVTRANLETSATLLALLHDSDLAPVEKAVRLAQVGSAAQARLLGFDPNAPLPALAGHALPSGAALALAAAYGVAPTEPERARLVSLDALPEPERAALARLLDAQTTFQLASKEAYARADPEVARAAMRPGSLEERLDRARGLAPIGVLTPPELMTRAGLDLGAVFHARIALLDAALRFHETFERGGGPRACEARAPVTLSHVLSIDLARCDNTYAEDVAFLLDGGGDDTYFNNAGGSDRAGNVYGVTATSCNVLFEEPITANALLDFSGDDRYVSNRMCGVNGGSYYGPGFLFDAKGHDAYKGGPAAVNGGAMTLYGMGFLLDAEGNDRYNATSSGTNGGGADGGVGFLLDGAGSDVYLAGFKYGGYGANGGGDFAGAGFLFDAGGNDRHLGVKGAGNGQNGGGNVGGFGFLLDASGNDFYGPEGVTAANADEGPTLFLYAVNGGGSFEGAGFLFDASGNDDYVASNGEANGGGALQAAGFLLDRRGNDHYVVVGGGIGNNGGGAAGGAGFLVDLDGNDRYRVLWGAPTQWRSDVTTGENGGSSTAVGTLLDARGNDRYQAVGAGTNGAAICANPSICITGAGILLDGDGRDRHSDEEGGSGLDRTVVPKGMSGAQVDRSRPTTLREP